MNLPILRDAPQYKAWRQIVKDQLLARNFTPLANFPIADFQQIVAGMRRLLPAWDQRATASAENHVVNMQQADKGVVQLVKYCIDKLTTTLNRCAQKAANGHVLGPIGQPGLPPAQLIVPALLLPLGAPVQWGPATAVTNPASVPQNALPVINQPQAQGQVVVVVVLAQPQLPINQPQGQGQAQLAPGVVQAQPQPPINQLQGQAHGQVQGQVVPGVVPAQPQRPINQPQGQVQGQVAPGVVPAQPQPPINQPQGQVQGQVVPRVLPSPPQIDPGVLPAQRQVAQAAIPM